MVPNCVLCCFISANQREEAGPEYQIWSGFEYEDSEDEDHYTVSVVVLSN